MITNYGPPNRRLTTMKSLRMKSNANRRQGTFRRAHVYTRTVHMITNTTKPRQNFV